MCPSKFVDVRGYLGCFFTSEIYSFFVLLESENFRKKVNKGNPIRNYEVIPHWRRFFCRLMS